MLGPDGKRCKKCNPVIVSLDGDEEDGEEVKANDGESIVVGTAKQLIVPPSPLTRTLQAMNTMSDQAMIATYHGA